MSIVYANNLKNTKFYFNVSTFLNLTKKHHQTDNVFMPVYFIISNFYKLRVLV